MASSSKALIVVDQDCKRRSGSPYIKFKTPLHDDDDKQLIIKTTTVMKVYLWNARGQVRVPAQQTCHDSYALLSSSLGGSMQAQCKGKGIVTILHS